MTPTEQRLTDALAEMSSHVTDEMLTTPIIRPVREATPVRRRLVIAAAAAAVVALALVPPIAARHRSTGTRALGAGVSDGPAYFVAVATRSHQAGVYDSSSGDLITAIQWPGGKEVSAVARIGDSDRFLAAGDPSDCRTELREITVTPDGRSFRAAVGPMLTWLPGRTSSFAITASGSLAALAVCSGGDPVGHAPVTGLVLMPDIAKPDELKVWAVPPGQQIYDGLDRGISLSRDGRQLAFLGAMPQHGLYVLDTKKPLTAARLVYRFEDGPIVALHLPQFVDADTLLVGIEGVKSGPEDATGYTLAKLSISTGRLVTYLDMPARGWEGMAIDDTRRHVILRIGERILRVDDGHLTTVIGRDAPMSSPVW